MRIWDKSKDLDISDDVAVISAINEAVKLRIALREKWINSERLVTFIDKNHDGIVDYDEFYEGLSQFRITENIDVDLVFAYMNNQNPESQSVSVSTMLETLNFNDDDEQEQEQQVGTSEGGQDDKNEYGNANEGGKRWPRYDSVHATSTLDGKEVKGIKEARGDSNDFPKTLLVGIVAHSNLHRSMLNFVQAHIGFFRKVRLITTDSTNSALLPLGLDTDIMSSGPTATGGDQENICSLIVKGEVAAVFFFTDPLSLHPHEADVTALNRICCVHDTMFANNPSTAQCLVYSLEHSAFGFSRLTGQHKSYQRTDSMIVEDYRHRINEGIWARGGEDSSTVTSKLTTFSCSGSTKHDDGSVGPIWNEDKENNSAGIQSKNKQDQSPTRTPRFLDFSNYRRGRSNM